MTHHTDSPHPATLHRQLAQAKLEAALLAAIERLDDARAWVRAADLDRDLRDHIDGARAGALKAFRLVDPDTSL